MNRSAEDYIKTIYTLKIKSGIKKFIKDNLLS